MVQPKRRSGERPTYSAATGCACLKKAASWLHCLPDARAIVDRLAANWVLTLSVRRTQQSRRASRTGQIWLRMEQTGFMGDDSRPGRPATCRAGRQCANAVYITQAAHWVSNGGHGATAAARLILASRAGWPHFEPQSMLMTGAINARTGPPDRVVMLPCPGGRHLVGDRYAQRAVPSGRRAHYLNLTRGRITVMIVPMPGCG